MNNLLIGVIGAGQMGSGIAAVCTLHGYRVILVDPAKSALNKAKDTISQNLSKLSASTDALSFHTDLNSLSTADLVIEAIPENLELKHALYAKISPIVQPDAIIATNTSSFPISELANHIITPQQFIGMHFMNPVLKMELVEVIPGHLTDKTTLAAALTFIASIKKSAVVTKDQSGFIVNRLLIPMINQAFIALENGLASKEDIDKAMEKGASFPMGPLKLADYIGIDTCLAIMKTLDAAHPKAGYAPAPLLQTYVDRNALGRKTKQGVYSY
jgi:3-hydroxybutyryl-CoA dehydrogenase